MCVAGVTDTGVCVCACVAGAADPVVAETGNLVAYQMDQLFAFYFI